MSFIDDLKSINNQLNEAKNSFGDMCFLQALGSAARALAFNYPIPLEGEEYTQEQLEQWVGLCIAKRLEERGYDL